MIKAIISDFDGTLVDTVEANYHAYQYVFKEVVNIELNKDFYVKNFGLRIDDICKQLNIEDQNIIKNIKNLKAQVYPNFFNYLKLNKDLLNTFNYFKNQGLTIALASTAASKNLNNVLNYFKISNTFDLIISGDDVKKGKPNPEVYNVALDKLGINNDEALVFEDSEAGIEAAKQANIKYNRCGRFYRFTTCI